MNIYFINLYGNCAGKGFLWLDGSVEVAVRDEKRQARALLSELEENLGKMDDKYPMLTWLSRHAAFCLGRFSIKDNGKIPYQMMPGRKWNRPMVSFGERIWFRRLDANKIDGER